MWLPAGVEIEEPITHLLVAAQPLADLLACPLQNTPSHRTQSSLPLASLPLPGGQYLAWLEDVLLEDWPELLGLPGVCSTEHPPGHGATDGPASDEATLAVGVAQGGKWLYGGGAQEAAAGVPVGQAGGGQLAMDM